MSRALAITAVGTVVMALAIVTAGQAAEELMPAERGGDVGKDLVAEGLDQPIYSAAAPGVSDILYVVERGGDVRALDPTDGSSVLFCEVPAVSTDGEGGLLSIAFDPDYQSNNLFYVYYTTDSSHKIRIDEFEANSDTDADEASQRRVMTIPHPGAANHQGGTIAFGPDGLLYAAPGDGGDAGDPDESAQDKGELTGKLLRIDPHGAGPGDHAIPPGNPFADKAGRDEIYALGLRNPFRFSFDPMTGKIGIGDVGQQAFEEVDVENEQSLRKANFGWDHFEGDHGFDYPGDNEAPRPSRRHYEPPVFDYHHGDRGHVITGGTFVRDVNLFGEFGRYLYADFAVGRLRSFEPHLGGATGERAIGVKITNPTSITSGPFGVIYITSLTTGKLFRLLPSL
jgi:glucose/arabinose dehydrogenase